MYTYTLLPGNCLAVFPLPAAIELSLGAIPRKGGMLSMREYELVFIVRPDLEENAVNDVVARVQGWITEAGGQVVKVDLWGKRKLAYPVRKQKEGQYVLMNIAMAPKSGIGLERNLRLYEPVIRFLVTAK
jgi:small subunit ribosomal protein S6